MPLLFSRLCDLLSDLEQITEDGRPPVFKSGKFFLRALVFHAESY